MKRIDTVGVWTKNGDTFLLGEAEGTVALKVNPALFAGSVEDLTRDMLYSGDCEDWQGEFFEDVYGMSQTVRQWTASGWEERKGLAAMLAESMNDGNRAYRWHFDRDEG